MNVPMVFKESKIELAITLIVVGITVPAFILHFIDLNATVGVDALTAVIALTTVLLKMHFDREVLVLREHDLTADLRTHRLERIIEALTEDTKEHCLRLVDEMLATCERINLGFLPLSEPEIFDRLIDKMKSLDQGWTVCAVSSCNWIRWANARPHNNYGEANRDAVNNGAIIRRVFVVSGDELKTPDVRKVIKDQRDFGVAVEIVLREDLHDLRDKELLRDFAVFSSISGARVLFSVDYDLALPEQVFSPLQITNPYEIDKYLRNFARLRSFHVQERELSRFLSEEGSLTH